ncbi:MAG: phage tail protein [Candidatus Korobacteraceae bacterium]
MSSTSPTLPPDPFRGFNFLVSLVDSSSSFTVVTSALQSLALGGFSECSGLEMSMDIEEYSEGGNNGTVLRFPTRVKWTNLRLKRGVTFADELWQWHYDFSRGVGKRRDGIVVLQDERHNPAKVWSFVRGLPVRWLGPSFNATQSQVAVEEVEIAHEGLTLWSLGGGISTALGIG